MAKVNSFIRLSGTLGDVTFVRSAVYGDIVRSKRGTYKPAVVNDSFLKSSEELKLAIPFAKLIKDNFNPYLTNFKDGTLWSRLRSFFRAQLRKHGKVNYNELKGLQFHRENSLSSLLGGNFEVIASRDAEDICVTVHLHSHPYFYLDYINAYRVTLIVVAISANSQSAKTKDHQFPITKLSSNVMEKQTLRFSVGKEIKNFVIALKCEGYQGNDMMNNVRTKGMEVVEVGA
jgi:hypothetical protein